MTNSSLNDVYNDNHFFGEGEGGIYGHVNIHFIVKMPEIVNVFSLFYSADLGCYHGYSKMML